MEPICSFCKSAPRGAGQNCLVLFRISGEGTNCYHPTLDLYYYEGKLCNIKLDFTK